MNIVLVHLSIFLFYMVSESLQDSLGHTCYQIFVIGPPITYVYEPNSIMLVVRGCVRSLTSDRRWHDNVFISGVNPHLTIWFCGVMLGPITISKILNKKLYIIKRSHACKWKCYFSHIIIERATRNWCGELTNKNKSARNIWISLWLGWEHIKLSLTSVVYLFPIYVLFSQWAK